MDPLEDGPPAEPLPDPIVTSSTTFDLGADLAALGSAAEEVRKLGGQASGARTLIDTAAGRIEADRSWEGDTADSFQAHRRRLTGDLGVVGDAAAQAAGALTDIAGILRSGQAMLDDQRDKVARVAVSSVPVRSPEPGEPESAQLTFEPRDDAEHAVVSAAVAAANEIRADVHEQLVTQAGRLRGILHGWSQYDPTHSSPPSLRTVSDLWKPRDVRVLTFNAGEGWHNAPGFLPGSDQGTGAGDIPEIGQVIAGSGANVISMQEMFERDAQRLLEWLNANAGGGWEMHFENAQGKMQWDAQTNPFLRDEEWGDFGNVVLVRTGGDVGDPVQQSPVELAEEVPLGIGGEGRVLQNTEVPLRE